MALMRWQPFHEIDALQREMNRLFDDVLAPSTRREPGMAFVPAAEVKETEEAIHLRLEVPGLEAKDLNVEVTSDAVSISGERQSKTNVEDGGVMRSEFRYGRFQRVIPLSTPIDNQNVQAEYKDGILALTLPKREDERKKVVKVNLN
ncbi:MAG: Hsp20/alpha crystallin family protein [Elainella sp. Prado103]|nr:Hsp20/alpha crystallin family protein [Elainella sp. Prado103]